MRDPLQGSDNATSFKPRDGDAVTVAAAENISGVKAVEAHTVCVEPMSGMVISMPRKYP